MIGEPVRVRVTCSVCSYETVVRRGAEKGPTDYIIAHGRETGHTLSVSSLDENQ